MKSYFIIFPHAGAIKSSYANIESCVLDKCEVVYVNYERHIDREATFDAFIESIWDFLNKKIKIKNRNIYIFAHSMGNCIVQALEFRLLEQYFVEKIIYSDGDIINTIPDNKLKNKTEQELQKIIDEEYDIPVEIRNNKVLLKHFQEILLRDLYILDMIPDYVERVGKIQLVSDVDRKIVLSDYMDEEKARSDWNEICKKKDFMKICGGHYTILDKFSEYVELQI